MALLSLYLLISIVGLYYGAEFALDSAEKVGRFFGLSPLVIGLLIVGFGTSLPEFFVSQLSCFRGEPGIAMGNIVGSNIANLFLIMGVSGLFVRLHLGRREILVQMVFHLIITIVLGVVLYFKVINWWTALVFFLFFSGYFFNTFREMKKNRELRHVEEDEEVEQINFFTFVKLFAGFVLLYFGGELLVFSGSGLGKELGISAYVISAVFVAFGTSFPELVTALLACYRKKNTDLITGNILGSNVFNVAFVLGSLGPYNFEITNNFTNEMIALGYAAILLLLLSMFRKSFTRIGGVLFLGSYLYTVFLWIRG